MSEIAQLSTEGAALEARIKALEVKAESWFKVHLSIVALVAGFALGLIVRGLL